MNTRFPVVAAAALTLGFAHLAPAAPKPLARPSAAMPAAADTGGAAKAALARMTRAYKTGQVISYASTVTMTIPASPDAQPTPTVVTATATVARPNRFHVETSQNGTLAAVLNCDGKTVTVYDPSQGQYAQADSGPTFRESMGAAQHAATGLFGQAGITKFVGAMVMPQIFFTAQPDLGASIPGHGIVYGAKPETIRGVKTTRIFQRIASPGGDVVVSFFIDPATGLPRRFSQDMSMGNHTTELIREDYTDLRIGTAPDSHAFAWTPPAAATLAVLPSAPEASSKLLAEGTTAPDFMVHAADGQTVKLSDYAGKVVVVDFWATWCGPCQTSLPDTDKVAQAYAPKGVVFLPVCSWDDAASFKTWVGKHMSLTMPFYFDPAGTDETNSIAKKSYGVDGIPTQYVIGKDGKVVANFTGYDPENDPSEKSLQQSLDKALAGS